MSWFKEHKISTKEKASSLLKSRFRFHDRAGSSNDSLLSASAESSSPKRRTSSTSHGDLRTFSTSPSSLEHSVSISFPDSIYTDSTRGTNPSAAIQLSTTADSSKKANARLSDRDSSLWDKAYEAFKTKDAGKNAKLIREYEALLQNLLNKSSVYNLRSDATAQPGIDNVSDNILSPAQRRTQLNRMLLEQGKNKHEVAGQILIAGHTISIRDQLATVAGIVNFSKDWIADALQASPAASVAWSVVCLGLPLLTKPAKVDTANSDGLIYVMSRIQFYIALEGLLLSSSSKSEYTSAQTKMYSGLQDRLVELYQFILDFQIKSIIRFNKGHWYEDLYGRSDWTAMCSNIKQLETTLRQDSSTAASHDLKILLQKTLEHAKETQLMLLDTQHKQLTAMQEVSANISKQVDIEREMNAAVQDIRFQGVSRVNSMHLQREADYLQMFRLDVLYETTKARIALHVQGTCQWFLGQTAYKDWLCDSSLAQCLLVSADPGCGKSVLARNLIDNELPRHNPSAFISYFFFNESGQDLLTIALPALLHQFLVYNRRLFKHVTPLLLQEGKKLMQNAELMLQILRDILVDMAGEVTTIVVLDALDECKPFDRERLITWVQSFQRNANHGSCQIKFLLTARPYDDILRSYEYNATSSQLHIPGNEESYAISQEVNLVIKHRAEDLFNRNRITETVRDELTNRLLAETNRTYLWVYVVFDELARKIGKQTLKEVQKVLKSLPATIYEAYENILNKYTDDEEIREKVTRVLNVMLAANRTLAVQEIQCAVKIELSPNTKTHDELDLEESGDFQVKLRNWCGLFIQIHDGKVSFLHQTARDFLHSKRQQQLIGTASTRWAGFTTPQQAALVMASVCLAYLLLDDFVEHIGLPPILFGDEDTSEDDDDEIDNARSCNSQIDDHESNNSDIYPNDRSKCFRKIFNRFPFLDYASLHWDSHFERGDCIGNSSLLQAALVLFDTSEGNYENWKRASNGDFSCLDHEPEVLDVAASMRSPSLLKAILQNYDLHLQVSAGRTALLMAASAVRQDNALLLLEHHANGDFGDGQAKSILHFSAAHGWIEIVLKLLEQGLDPNSTDHDGESPLHVACRDGYADIVNLLLKYGADARLGDIYNYTPLHDLRKDQQEKIVDLLLEGGADIDALNNFLETPMFRAVYSGQEDLVHYLLRHGANPNIKDFLGKTPLQEAVGKQEERIINLLLRYGANPNVQDTGGRTLLHYAVRSCQEKIVNTLLSYGADPNVENGRGYSPLWMAVDIKQENIVMSLCKYKANVNHEEEKGSTALMIAAEAGHSKIIQILLEAGAHHSSANNYGYTSLHLAATRGHLEAAKTLIEVGKSNKHPTTSCFNINAQTKYGSTALIMAAENGHLEMVRLLLENGADATLTDADYDTAWTSAVKCGFTDIAQLLPQRKLSKRSSLSDLWPSKPFWEPSMNGHNSTFNTRERRPFDLCYTLSQKKSVDNLRTVVPDQNFLRMLEEHRQIQTQG